MKPFNEENPRKGNPFKVGFMGFHGDVTVYGLKELPENFERMEDVPDSCVAYGELTGHVHKIIGEPEVDFKLKRDPKTKAEYLKVDNVIYLKHQEHSPVELQPGIYKFGRQLERDPFEKRMRQVID